MAMSYTIKILKLKVNDQIQEIGNVNDLIFYPRKMDNLPYYVELQYVTSKKVKKFFGLMEGNEITRVSSRLKFEEVQVEVVSPPEKGRNNKNMGVGAVAGAVVAGPIGAAAGAWVGTKIKNVEVKVTIPSENIVFIGKVSSGFVPALEKAKTSSTLLDDF
ncbi:hypothetical protein [Aliiglaciecola aliphaticivorans]